MQSPSGAQKICAAGFPASALHTEVLFFPRRRVTSGDAVGEDRKKLFKFNIKKATKFYPWIFIKDLLIVHVG